MSVTALSYIALIVAIVMEVIGTAFLQASNQFTRLWPTLGMAVSYIGAFYLLTVALRVMPLGVAYAMWAGLGIVLVTAVGYVVFKQSLDLPALIGIGCIVLGVVIINGFSSVATH